MTSKEIVNKWGELLLSDWCSNEFWENTLNQKNQLIKDLDRLEKLDKVIKIINNKLALNYMGSNLTEEEEKLLKEVFGYEKC